MTAGPTVLGGRYELGPVLGRGGMAEVRRARDSRLGRDVAIKQLRADLAGDPTFQARFRREAQSAAGLNHPTIVSVYDTGTSKDPHSDVEIPYIVMELVEGNTLRDVLREGRRILPERAFEISQGVLDALSYSHKAGIIHRDIKPANVMLTKTGQVKVMDFGIARAVADTSATMTQTAAVIGTAQYLSPEQARGETVDARSDLYSAGCLLYELLTGRPPFVGDSPVSVAYQHVRETPVAPSQIGEGDALITPAMDAIVLKALGKSPDERYQSAKEMRDDITRLLSGEAPLATVPAGFAADPAQDQIGTQLIPAATQVAPAAPITVTSGLPAYQTGSTPVVPAEEPPKRRGLTVLLVALVLAALGTLAFGTYAFLNRTPAAQPVTIPTVTEKKQAEAEKMINDAGLPAPKVETVEGADDDTVGTVTKQDPSGGTVSTPGATMTIWVNVGPSKVAMPKVVGQGEQSAREELGRYGLTNVVVEEVANEPADARSGQVLKTDPVAGTSVAKGTRITLYVATGKTTVPDVRNLTRVNAKRALTKAGFRVVVKSEQSTQRVDTVIRQDPVGGTSAPKESTVTITVSEPAPEPTKTSEPPSETPTPTQTSEQPSPPPTSEQPTTSAPTQQETSQAPITSAPVTKTAPAPTTSAPKSP